jgi:hypothetical protein
MATTSPCRPAEAESLLPLPPTPTHANRIFSFGDVGAAQDSCSEATQNAVLRAAEVCRKSRREVCAVLAGVESFMVNFPRDECFRRLKRQAELPAVVGLANHSPWQAVCWSRA